MLMTVARAAGEAYSIGNYLRSSYELNSCRKIAFRDLPFAKNVSNGCYACPQAPPLPVR